MYIDFFNPVLFATEGDAPSKTKQEGSKSDSLPSIWRRNDNEEVNCLYLFLRLNGHAIDYHTVLRQMSTYGPLSGLQGIVRGANTLGLNCQIIKCTPEDLKKLPLPVIGYFDHPEATGSHIDLILGVTPDRCSLCTGGHVMLNELSMDDFRRRWTGFVVTANPASGVWREYLAGILIGVSLAWMWRTGLFRKLRRSVKGGSPLDTLASHISRKSSPRGLN
jgi:ABC-type bacteriocin/lantibiotic exporter with double-glycine peptidase domain